MLTDGHTNGWKTGYIYRSMPEAGATKIKIYSLNDKAKTADPVQPDQSSYLYHNSMAPEKSTQQARKTLSVWMLAELYSQDESIYFQGKEPCHFHFICLPQSSR